MLEEWKTFTQKSVPEYSWQLYLWSPKTGNQLSIFHWVNATVIYLLYNDILFTDFSQLSIELCLNKPFSVENNKNAFNIPNPAYIKGAQHLKKKEEEDMYPEIEA